MIMLMMSSLELPEEETILFCLSNSLWLSELSGGFQHQNEARSLNTYVARASLE